MAKDMILLVDDEPSLIELLEYNFSKEGYDVLSANNGDDAVRLFKENPVSLLILDIMMPGMDGFAVCRELRKTSNVPIIMLTAKSGETNKIVGLELGADDYVTKPFSIGELAARVKAVLRRSAISGVNSDEPETITIGVLKIDRRRREVTVNDKKIILTTREFDLLYLFVSNPGIVFTRDQILDRVWGNESCVVDRAVDVHIRHLREKIEPDPGSPRFISTIRGVGYRFEG